MTVVRQIRLYPFMLAAYPAVALLSANVGEASLPSLTTPLIASLGIATLIYVLAWRFSRDPNRAAALTAWLLLLLLSYGHAYDLLKGVSALGIRPGRHLLLFPAWLLVAVPGCLLIARSRPSGTFAAAATLIALAALAQPAFRILSYQARSATATARVAEAAADQARGLGLPPMRTTPDIYYIILDGYARHDVLSQYGFDNAAFLKDLERLGFVIASCSQSNYSKTQLSLASSLNSEYLEALAPSPSLDSSDTTWLAPAIQNSWLRQFLEAHGYGTVAFETGYPYTELHDADMYLRPSASQEHQVRGLSAFEELFVRSTVGAFILDGLSRLPGDPASELTEAEKWKRNHVLFVLDSLENLTSVPGPKFVFAHIVAPHSPYVFGPGGEAVHSPEVEAVPRPEAVRAYTDQARYISGRITEVLETILSTSASPPVLVLQADHGPDLSSPEANVRILNAFLFPGAEGAIYPGLTPVNAFRVVLNQLTGGDLPLLEDVSHFSRAGDPFDFAVIPPSCEG